MNAHAQKIESIQKNIALALGGLLALLIALYAFYLSSAIRNVVAREKLSSDSSALHAAIAASEQEYVALKDSVTLDLAFSLGYVAASHPIFVSTAAQGKILSLNTR